MHVCECRIHGDILPVERSLKNSFHGVLKNAAIPFLAFPQRILRSLPIRDVFGDAQ